MKEMHKFLEVAGCVDKLLLDNFLHDNGYDHQKSVSENLDNLMKYIKNRHK